MERLIAAIAATPVGGDGLGAVQCPAGSTKGVTLSEQIETQLQPVGRRVGGHQPAAEFNRFAGSLQAGGYGIAELAHEIGAGPPALGEISEDLPAARIEVIEQGAVIAALAFHEPAYADGLGTGSEVSAALRADWIREDASPGEDRRVLRASRQPNRWLDGGPPARSDPGGRRTIGAGCRG